jgi:hypothetical protein
VLDKGRIIEDKVRARRSIWPLPKVAGLEKPHLRGSQKTSLEKKYGALRFLGHPGPKKSWVHTGLNDGMALLTHLISSSDRHTDRRPE